MSLSSLANAPIFWGKKKSLLALVHVVHMVLCPHMASEKDTPTSALIGDDSRKTQDKHWTCSRIIGSGKLSHLGW